MANPQTRFVYASRDLVTLGLGSGSFWDITRLVLLRWYMPRPCQLFCALICKGFFLGIRLRSYVKTVTCVTGTVTKGNKWVLDFGSGWSPRWCVIVGGFVWWSCIVWCGWFCVAKVWVGYVLVQCVCDTVPKPPDSGHWLRASVVKSLDVSIVNAWFCGGLTPRRLQQETEYQWLTTICYNLGEGVHGPWGGWTYTYTHTYTDQVFSLVNYRCQVITHKSHTQPCQQLQRCNSIAMLPGQKTVRKDSVFIILWEFEYYFALFWK